MYKIITIFLAMISMIYELNFAYLGTILYGGNYFNYVLTIGLYTTFMGIGSLFYGNIFFKKNKFFKFIYIEILLIFLGGFGSYYLVEFPEYNLKTIYYFLIIGIAFLSGLELPFLMDLYKNSHNDYDEKIYFLDFTGTFFGTIVVSYYTMYFNIKYLSTLFAFLNLLMISLLIIKYKPNYQKNSI